MLQEELVTTAPAFAGLSKHKFAMLEVDPEAYAEHVEFIRSLNVRGYKADEGIEWQYDGMTYPENDERRKGPLKPGQTTIVALEVAMHGIKRTASWHQEEVSAGDGQIVKRPDFRAEGRPLLRIIRIFEPGRVDRLLAEAEAQTSLCPWCSPVRAIPTAEFKQHVEREHFSEPVAAVPAAKRAAKGQHVADEDDE
jgi:hypothetical protein